jgi:hypothetical protein
VAGSEVSGPIRQIRDDVGVTVVDEGLSVPPLSAEALRRLGTDPTERFDLRLHWPAAAAAALQTDEIDVVLLNQATPLMRHRAIRDGQLLVERDRRARVRMETKGILDYLDTKPLRAELARGTRHRIEEGRFGRR